MGLIYAGRWELASHAIMSGSHPAIRLLLRQRDKDQVGHENSPEGVVSSIICDESLDARTYRCVAYSLGFVMPDIEDSDSLSPLISNIFSYLAPLGFLVPGFDGESPPQIPRFRIQSRPQ